MTEFNQADFDARWKGQRPSKGMAARYECWSVQREVARLKATNAVLLAACQRAQSVLANYRVSQTVADAGLQVMLVAGPCLENLEFAIAQAEAAEQARP